MSLTHLTSKEYVKFAPETPLWQALEWKTYQESLGRECRLYGLKASRRPFGAPQPDTEEMSAPALVVIDTTAFGLSVWDIPRGPVGASEEAVLELLEGIVEEAREEGCMVVYFSPIEKFSIFNFQFSNRRMF